MSRKRKNKPVIQDLPNLETPRLTKTTVKNKATRNKQKQQKVKSDIRGAVSVSTIPLRKASSLFKREKPKEEKAKRKGKLSEYRDTTSQAQPVTAPKSLADFKEKATFRESEDKGSLLQQYKDTKEAFSSQMLPTMREVGWDNFKQALDELPDEIQMDFKRVIDYLVLKYGEKVVAYYLDKRGLLETTAIYHGIDYKSMIARIYLYQLATTVESLATGEPLSGGYDDIREEAVWMSQYSIQSVASVHNRAHYEGLLEPENIQSINLKYKLDEFFDSEYGEDYR